MPTFEFTSPEGRKYSVNGPAGATKEQAFHILQQQISAAPATSADIPAQAGSTAASRAPTAAPAATDTMLGKMVGAVEPLAAMASGAVGAAVGSIAGAAKTITGGKFGTQAGLREGKTVADQVAANMTYQPRTQAGAAGTVALSQMAAPLAGLQGIASADALRMGATAASSATALRGMAGPSAAAMGVQDAAAAAGGGKLRDLVRAPKPAMAGGGAALTEAATLRAERAASQPVPPKLTRGQLTRDFKDVQFERETAKNPDVGGPLRQRYSEQNQNSLQNIEAYFDETGASTPNLYASGRIVTDVVVGKAKRVKQQIKTAYNEAREAGHMAEAVPVQALREYVEKNRPSMRNAPVIATLEDELNRLTGGSGTLDLNSIEELRKTIGKNGKPNASNSNAGFAPGIVELIDQITDGKGGPKYQQARRMYQNYANEFKNVGVIDKLMRTKPNTKDRMVAYEDVYQKTIAGAGVSLDDVRHVRRTLQTAGEDGQQAWRELQGQGIQDLRREVFGNVSRDEWGNPIASPAKMNAWVENMDEGGKLDFIYGKKGAQKIRDTRDLLMDTHTSPPGSVNSSNTASALAALFDLGASASTGIPLPVATAAKIGIKRYKTNQLKKRVDSALNPEKP